MAGPQLSGVTALVACGAGRLLVLERSAGPGLPPFENRIYLVDTLAAPDVSACLGPLQARSDVLASKTWKDSALGRPRLPAAGHWWVWPTMAGSQPPTSWSVFPAASPLSRRLPAHDHVRFNHLPRPLQIVTGFVHVEADRMQFVPRSLGEALAGGVAGVDA